MNKESLTEKLLDLAEGRETPETWQNWWDEHETELEALLSRGEFLKLKPCRHGFQWVPVFGSQKGAIAILEKSGTAFEASNLYQERYLAELDAFCKEQERVQREKQKEFKASHPELFGRYPKFSKALAKVLDTSDEIKPAATEEQIGNQESVLDFTLPSQVREFFLLTAGIFTGAVWANASWGRYWGWDPKEVWALITLIVYALPLHEQSLARFRRPLFFHAYTLWAFAAVLMTYFGVNYLLGGMHSYGGGFRPGYAAATVFAAVTAFALLTVAALIRQRRTDA